MSQAHWDEIYNSKPTEELGWYQATPQPDLDTILSLDLQYNDRLLIIGVGRSNIVQSLYDQGYRKLICTDISEVALNKFQNDIKAKTIKTIQDDLCSPSKLRHIDPVDLWYDRAVLHFLKDDQERKSYFQLLNTLVKPNGYVLFAQFSTHGAKRCSGLDVFQYDLNHYKEFLGNDFVTLKAFEHIYTMPNGESRPYIYGVFQRKGRQNK